MFVSKFLLPAVAVVGLAAAQSSSCSDSSATHTISSQADATALASSCSTVSGSVAIASTVAGAIALDGIQQIKGDLTCNGAVNLTSLSGSTLNAIGGKFQLTSLTLMSTLGFPSLTSVKTISWTTLDALQELTFTQGLSTVDSILISDTQLNDLNGVDNIATLSSFNINNNKYLNLIHIDFTNVTGLLNIDSNGPKLVVEFPSLSWAFNMTLRNLTSISFNSLNTVNSTLGFYGDLMTTISAPNLTAVNGDLAVVANPNLQNISMPLLKTIGGGFQVANNTALDKINAFPSLKSTGAINFTGNFSDCELPSLSTVAGSFNMQSSGAFDCSPFQKDKDNSIIHGTYTCVSSSKNVQSSGTGTSSGSSSSSTGSKSAAPISISSVDMSTMMLPVLAGFFAMMGGVYQLL